MSACIPVSITYACEGSHRSGASASPWDGHNKLVWKGRSREGRGGSAVRSFRASQRLACCVQSPQADLVVKEQRATATPAGGTRWSCVCSRVFITVVPLAITSSVFAWGRGIVEDMCHERRRAEALVGTLKTSWGYFYFHRKRICKSHPGC